MSDQRLGNDYSVAAFTLPERRPRREPDVAAVALPDQVPPQPDVSLLPDSVLHSGAVETLIGQNEDLMARLKVNIRRCAVLERQVMDQERHASDLRRINASVTAQIQILCEKEHVWKERAAIAERERRRLRALEGFHRRIARWIRPRFKSAVRAESAAFARAAEASDLKARLATALDRARALEENQSRDQATLVASHEAQMAEARSEVERLTGERVYLKDRSERLEDARRALSEAENEVILRNRQRGELERKLNEDVGRLQVESTGYRQEAKRIAVELVAAVAAQAKLEATRTSLTRTLERANDQFESLRAVWTESQKKADSLASRNDALARINQELARKLRDDRLGSATDLCVLDPELATANAAARSDGFERIDALLAEIESGF